MKNSYNKIIFISILLGLNFQFKANASDTIGRSDKFMPVFAPQGKIITLKDGDGGYLLGIGKKAPFLYNNAPIGKVFALGQGYENLDSISIKITHVLSHISFKKSNSPSPISKLDFTIHPLIGGKAFGDPLSDLADQDGPGMQFAGKASLSYNDIKIGADQFSIASFATPIQTNGPIAIVCNLTDFLTKRDTIGFYSDLLGDGYGLAWRAVEIENNWKRFYSTTVWNANVNIALFAVIEETVSVNDLSQASLVNGTRALMYPNPASENTNLRFETNLAGNWSIDIIAQDGKILQQNNLGYKQAGVHDSSISLSGLSDGTYFYSLINPNGQRYTKSFLICK